MKSRNLLHKMVRHATFAFSLTLPLMFLLCPNGYAGRDEAAAAYSRGDYATAFKELKWLADKGDVQAQAMVGFMYANGLGVSRDYAQALEWTRRAADQGDAKAQHNLGVMYENGTGVQQDFTKAASLYEKAAAKGDVSATSNLGLLYIQGRGVKKDLAKGVRLYSGIFL